MVCPCIFYLPVGLGPSICSAFFLVFVLRCPLRPVCVLFKGLCERHAKALLAVLLRLRHASPFPFSRACPNEAPTGFSRGIVS